MPYWLPGAEGQTRRRSPIPAKPISWELGEPVSRADFATNGNGKADANAKLPAGIYRAVLETTDKFGKKVTAKHQFTVVNPAADKFNVKIANLVDRAEVVGRTGRGVHAALGERLRHGPRFIEVEHTGKIIKQYWTEAGLTQQVLKQPVTEEMRGGFTVRVTQVRENRAYLTSPARRCAVEQQEPDREVGAVRLQAPARAEGDLHRDRHRAGREEGGRRDGRGACTTRRSTPTCRTTGWSASTSSARTSRP